MSERLLEEKRRLLERRLQENLQKKHLVEMSIREQLEELKRLEITLEKTKAIYDKSRAMSTPKSLLGFL